ncbi:ion transporter [Bacillaceae bacterium W0354]
MKQIQQRCLKIVENKGFQNAILILILINAITIGMETFDPLYAKYSEWFIKIDFVILIIFTLEIVMKLIAAKPMFSFFKDGWNVFDFIIVASSYIFTGSSYVIVLRILRVFRVFRTISVIPSLRKLVNALLMTLPSLGNIMILLSVIFYIFSVIGTELFSETNPEYFGTIFHTALTLFQMVTLESWASGVMRPVMESSPWAWIYFVSFIIVGAFVVINLFVGVIVSNFEKVEQLDMEEHYGQQDDLAKEVSQLRKEIIELKDLLKK